VPDYGKICIENWQILSRVEIAKSRIKLTFASVQGNPELASADFTAGDSIY
jgi:hypothetical protein